MGRNGIDHLVQPLRILIGLKYQVIFYLFLAYEGKANQANQANEKVLIKYEGLRKHIEISGASEAEVLKFLPKVQVTKFIE